MRLQEAAAGRLGHGEFLELIFQDELNVRHQRMLARRTNRPLEDWGKLLSDVPTAGAILDRFLHHAITIAITGRSYRIKDSLPPAPEGKKAKKPNEPSTAGAAS